MIKIIVLVLIWIVLALALGWVSGTAAKLGGPEDLTIKR